MTDRPVRGLRGDGFQSFDGPRIDHHLAPLGRIDVTVFLPSVNIRFVKSDGIATFSHRLQQAAIIGRRTVPV